MIILAGWMNLGSYDLPARLSVQVAPESISASYSVADTLSFTNNSGTLLHRQYDRPQARPPWMRPV